MKLKDIIEFRGYLLVGDSGLRIGGSKDYVGIGETDNPIIRNPMTDRPYVPGSSIKGKLRSLLELKRGFKPKKPGQPCACGTCDICLLFGPHDTAAIQSPTRLIFRDCQPTPDTIEMWEKAGTDTDVKTEVLIDRNKGVAYGNIGPRTSERIPAESVFNFSFSVRLFEGDDRKKLLETVAEGFDLLEKDYLGGYGSRGYGKVWFFGEDGETPLSDVIRKAAQEG